MIQLYHDIERNYVAGQWCSLEKCFTLASMVVTLRPEFSLEIGIFEGGSFFPMALAHRYVNHGILVGVEAWDKNVAVAAQTTEEDRRWWAALDMEAMYQRFMLRRKELQLEPFTKIERVQSRQATFPARLGLVHIDGAHNDEAVNDVARVAQRVHIGGIVVLDDLHWYGGGVSRAEYRLEQIGYEKLYGLGTGAVYQRMR